MSNRWQRLAAMILAVITGPAIAGDVVVGSVERDGMEINAVYIQPIFMPPETINRVLPRVPGSHI